MEKTLKTVLIMLFTCIPIFSSEYRVLYIIDGDTIAVRKIGNKTGKIIKVRLFGIDAPELKQRYGYKSKQVLINFIKDKDVEIMEKRKDRYGRLIGVVYHNKEKINEKMVKTGNAWWYEKYNKNDMKMKKYQEYAQKNRLGLFAEKGYIFPWEFRKSRKN